MAKRLGDKISVGKKISGGKTSGDLTVAALLNIYGSREKIKWRNFLWRGNIASTMMQLEARALRPAKRWVTLKTRFSDHAFWTRILCSNLATKLLTDKIIKIGHIS